MILLDGGMGRHLKEIGAPFGQPEWSALALIDDPSYVLQAHNDFIDAGSDYITTNSYAIIPFHLGNKIFNEKAKELLKLSGELAKKAKELRLEVLLEVHNIDEINLYSNDSVDIIGVNNRDLKTFKTNMGISKKLLPHISNDYMKISESGISKISSIKELKDIGYDGFLIGENFMKNENPGKMANNFINSLKI